MVSTIRHASSGDAPVVGRLLHDFNVEFDSPTPSAADFSRRLAELLARPDVLVVLSEEQGTATGFAFLTLRPTPYGDGPLAQLEELYVVPHLRDQGIGTQILEAAIAEVIDRGAIEVHINVDEPDVDTRRFYERHGFTNVEASTGERMLCYLRELLS